MGSGISHKDDTTSTGNPERENNKNPNTVKKDNKLKPKKKEKKSSSSMGNFLASTSKSVGVSTNKVKIVSTIMSVQSMASVLHPILNYSTDHQDVQQALELLEQYEFNVNAIWVVSRPIDRVANGKFNHWAIKILADPILLTLDFFEKNGSGSFGVHAVTVGWEELEEFLFYYKKENDQWKKKQWKIESYVMPTFEQNQRKQYNNISPDDELIYKMPEEITDCKLEMDDLNDNNNNNIELMSGINCDKIVSDISNFIQQWNEKYECYNALTNNCQRFVQDLYEWLLSDKEETDGIEDLKIHKEYIEKCKSLASKLQSWGDWVVEVEKWKKYEIETNKQDPFEDENQNRQVGKNQIRSQLKQNTKNVNKQDTIKEENENIDDDDDDDLEEPQITENNNNNNNNNKEEDTKQENGKN